MAVREANYKNICRYFQTFSYFRAHGVFLVAHAERREEGATPRLASHRQSTLLGETLHTHTPSPTSRPSSKTPEELRDTTVCIHVFITTCTQNHLSIYKLNATETLTHTHIHTQVSDKI